METEWELQNEENARVRVRGCDDERKLEERERKGGGEVFHPWVPEYP
jgi:hypothetical protein